MIYDNISHMNRYAAGIPKIVKVLEAMKEYSSDNYPSGRVDIDGNNAFLLFNEYQTHDKEEAKFEAHRKYIDVMYMVEGSEIIYVKPVDELQNIIQEYDDNKECLLAELDEDTSAIKLTEGRFVVLYPQDAHAPACNDGDMKKVKKIIGKVLFD